VWLVVVMQSVPRWCKVLFMSSLATCRRMPIPSSRDKEHGARVSLSHDVGSHRASCDHVADGELRGTGAFGWNASSFHIHGVITIMFVSCSRGRVTLSHSEEHCMAVPC
jgi:hypothetical protein